MVGQPTTLPFFWAFWMYFSAGSTFVFMWSTLCGLPPQSTFWKLNAPAR